jgi:hypothetical protein
VPSFVWGRTMSHPVLVLAFAGPLFAPLLSADRPVEAAAVPARWTSVSLSAELRAKDTGRINLVTAGEDQKSSMSQCEAADDADLCRLLIAVVNVAAVVGSVVTGP